MFGGGKGSMLLPLLVVLKHLLSSAMRDEAKWHESTKEVGFGFKEIGRSECETEKE